MIVNKFLLQILMFLNSEYTCDLFLVNNNNVSPPLQPIENSNFSMRSMGS